MHWEAVIDQVWRCTGRPQLIKFGDALGGRDRANLEMDWDAVIQRVWKLYLVLTHDYGMERQRGMT